MAPKSPDSFEDFTRDYVIAMHSFLLRRFGGRWRQDSQLLLGARAPAWVTHAPYGLPRPSALTLFESRLVKLGFDPTNERKRIASDRLAQYSARDNVVPMPSTCANTTSPGDQVPESAQTQCPTTQ